MPAVDEIIVIGLGSDACGFHSVNMGGPCRYIESLIRGHTDTKAVSDSALDGYLLARVFKRLTIIMYKIQYKRLTSLGNKLPESST